MADLNGGGGGTPTSQPEFDPDEFCQPAEAAPQVPPAFAMVKCAPGSHAWTHSSSLLENTWIKEGQYAFLQLIDVEEIQNPELWSKYEAYKESMRSFAVNGNELMLFHGCSEAAIDSISRGGFLKSFQTTAAGSWQRYGPGFYFAMQASKSHEYPVAEMQAVAAGTHRRKMILCKVARGRELMTSENMDTLTGAAPPGYDSVHGKASSDGPLNYDELVVYAEDAILPYAVVTYEYVKHEASAGSSRAVPLEESSLYPDEQQQPQQSGGPSGYPPSRSLSQTGGLGYPDDVTPQSIFAAEMPRLSYTTSQHAEFMNVVDSGAGGCLSTHALKIALVSTGLGVLCWQLAEATVGWWNIGAGVCILLCWGSLHLKARQMFPEYKNLLDTADGALLIVIVTCGVCYLSIWLAHHSDRKGHGWGWYFLTAAATLSGAIALIMGFTRWCQENLSDEAVGLRMSARASRSSKSGLDTSLIGVDLS